MYFVSFYVYCAERTRWAEVFAGTATDALLFVDNGDEKQLLAGYLFAVGIAPAVTVATYARLQGHHLYGTGRALAGAESAWLAVLNGNTQLACPYGVTYLDGCSLFHCDGLDGRGGTYL